MSRLTICLALSLAMLAAACSSNESGPTAPALIATAITGPAELTAGPKLALSDSSIRFCYHPGTTRNCVFLSERVRITSTVRSVHWSASSNRAWLGLSATSGSTPARVTISVDLKQVPQPHGLSVSGAITVRSAGATNSPLTIPVTLWFIAVSPG
jgi:hypothetical protein